MRSVQKENAVGQNQVYPPGKIIREYLEARCWNQTDLAKRTGITPKTVSEICNGKAPITPRTAYALGKVFQSTTSFWLNLQRQFDEWLLMQQHRLQQEQWSNWTQKFPINQLKKIGYISPSDMDADITESLLSFLGVVSPDSLERVWETLPVTFRQTRIDYATHEYTIAWIRLSEFYAQAIAISDFKLASINNSIELLRSCAGSEINAGLRAATSICASNGIALVFLPEFNESGITCCARWLTPKRAIIALSDRLKTDDLLWFTLFHELGHLLLHKNTNKFFIDNAVDSVLDKVVDPQVQKLEDEANRFAEDALVPPAMLADFINDADLSDNNISSFAHSIGVKTSIVVARLQREELLKKSQFNRRKRKINSILKSRSVPPEHRSA